jgi:NADH-quinone oxidoreductase subunit M
MLASEGAAIGFPILTVLVLTPVLGAFAILFTRRSRPEYAKLIALISSVGAGALSIWMMSSFDTGDAGFQFVSKQTWIEQWGISWHLGVDGISLFLSCSPRCCSRW